MEFLQGSASAGNTVRLEPSLDLGLSAWAPERSDLAGCDGKNAGVLTASIQLFFVSHGQPFLEEFGERSSCLRVIGVFFLEADSTLYGGQEFAYLGNVMLVRLRNELTLSKEGWNALGVEVGISVDLGNFLYPVSKV